MSAHVEPGLRIAIASDVSERLAARGAAPRRAGARAGGARDGRAAQPHQGRLHRRAVARAAHAAQRDRRLGAVLDAARPHRRSTMSGLEAIERNVKAQARIISDILDVSRINSGKLRLRTRARRPGRGGRERARHRCAPRSTRRTCRWSSTSRARTQPAWLDPARFQQIALEPDDQRHQVLRPGRADSRVAACARPDRLVLGVQDFGRGIAAEFLPRLFDRFSQSDAPGNRTHGGLGLGLSIVRHLVELHGGGVRAASAGAGLGATMAGRLPRRTGGR